MTPKELTLEAARILSDKKAHDIAAVCTRDLTTLTDYFLLATADNTTHVRALSDELAEKLKESCGVLPQRVEGYQSASWILMDYGGLIVHIFYRETRGVYDIERLWADAPRLDLSAVAAE